MKTLVELGEEFRTLREATGLTQSEVAQRTGMRQEALSRFERGRGNDFSLAKLLRLAQALGHDLQLNRAHERPTLDDVLAERRADASAASASPIASVAASSSSAPRVARTSRSAR